jgi:hypothetical protein
VILEYSVEEDTMSNHQVYGNSVKKEEKVYGHQEKIGKNCGNIGMEEGSPLSPIIGSLSNTIELLGTDKSKPGHLTVNTNYTTKNETRNWVDGDVNSHNFFVENINGEQSNSFQFHNSSNPGLGSNSRFIMNHNNQVSSSMLNFSLDGRKEMLESVRPRLI